MLAEGLRGHRRLFALAVAAGCAYGVAGALTGWWVGRATDAVVVPALTDAAAGRPSSVGSADAWRAGGVLAAVYLVSVVTQVVRRVAAGTTMFGVQADHRRRVTRRYLDLPLAWHRARPTGRLLSTAGSDVDTTWQVLAPLPFALGTLAMVLAAGTAMALADPVLAAVAGVVVPAIAATSVLYQRRVSPRIARAQAARGEVAGVAHESFEGALVVKVLGRRDVELERFTHATERLRAANTAAGTARGGFDAVVEALPALGVLAVLALGAARVAEGSARTADVVQVAYLLTLLAFPVRAIGWVLADLPRTVVGHERLDAVLSAPLREAPAAVELPGAGSRPGSGRPVTARLEGVRVRHPAADETAAPALDGVTLDVAAGTTLAVVGPTGSGKSTLAGLLLRLVDPADGRVLLDGVDLQAVADGELAGAAALVPQSVFVFDDTVRGNVALGLEVDDAQVWAALAAASADDVVRALPRGLDTPVGERGTTLSGGQRQRLAIARALVRRPRLLVLDDATSALDPAVEEQVLGRLRAGAGGGGRPTVVVVASRPATIALADEVVHLDAGRLVDRGRPEELLARDPGYRDLVTAYARAALDRELAAR